MQGYLRQQDSLFKEFHPAKGVDPSILRNAQKIIRKVYMFLISKCTVVS